MGWRILLIETHKPSKAKNWSSGVIAERIFIASSGIYQPFVAFSKGDRLLCGRAFVSRWSTTCSFPWLHQQAGFFLNPERNEPSGPVRWSSSAVR